MPQPEKSFIRKAVESLALKLILVIAAFVGTAVLTWYTANSAWIHGIPGYKVGLIVAGIFALCSVGTYFLVLSIARIPLRNAPAGSLLEPVKGRTEDTDTRLLEVAAADRREIDATVFVYGVKFHNLIEASHSPSIQFDFNIFNGSVYPVSIDPTVSGSISYGDQRLKGEMTISSEFRPNNLPRGWTAIIKLSVWLDMKQAHTFFYDLERVEVPAPIYFDFDQLVITIHGGEEYVELVKPKRLRFRGCKAIDKNQVLR